MSPPGRRIATGARVALTLALLAPAGAACGDPPPSTETPGRVAVHLELLAGREAAPQTFSSTTPIQLRLTLHNSTDSEVRLSFASGRTHDVVITGESGAVRWRWSDGRMFSQALSEIVLAPDEDQTFELLCDPGEIAAALPGAERYRATALIPSFDGELRSASVEFELE